MSVETLLEIEEFTIEGIEQMSLEGEEREKWEKLVEESGAEGQKTLVSAETILNPYPNMTMEQKRVYRLCMSKITLFYNYDIDVIPTRVLELAKLAKDAGLESKYQLEVWHEPGTDDPMLVAKLDWDSYCPIARWGKHLVSFEELRQMAIKKMIPNIKKKLSEHKVQIAGIESDIEAAAKVFLSGEGSNTLIDSVYY